MTPVNIRKAMLVNSSIDGETALFPGAHQEHPFQVIGNSQITESKK